MGSDRPRWAGWIVAIPAACLSAAAGAQTTASVDAQPYDAVAAALVPPASPLPSEAVKRGITR